MRSLERFADNRNIPWNPPTTFRPNQIVTATTEVPSFSLRTALSAIPFVSGRWIVDVKWFQGNSSQALPNSKELSVWTTFGLQELLQALLCFLRSFLRFTWVGFYPLCSRVQYHDSVSMMAFPTARETFENSFPSPEKFSFYTCTIVSMEWLRSCTTTAYLWLFRDSPPSLTNFVICCCQVTELFCS